MPTLDDYSSTYGQSAKTIDTKLKQLGPAMHSVGFFSGGHAFLGVAGRMTFAWFDRWLGRTME